MAETEEAVVAPARSHRRWNTGRATFSPLRGSAIAPVTTTVWPAGGASFKNGRGQVHAMTALAGTAEPHPAGTWWTD